MGTFKESADARRRADKRANPAKYSKAQLTAEHRSLIAKVNQLKGVVKRREYTKYTTEEERIAGTKIKVDAAARRWQRKNRPLSREISPLPSKIDWKRRLECKNSLQRFCEVYLAPVFYHAWSEDQLICIKKVEIVCREGGKFCVAMPRGGGKTAIVRAGTLWATLYGYKKFIYNIGSTEPKSTQTLNFVKVQLANNPGLQQDFPEISYPIFVLEGTNRMAGGQLYNGEPTHVHLGTEQLRYPTLQLSAETAQYYREHDPESVRYVVPGQAQSGAGASQAFNGPVQPGDSSPKEEPPDGIWITANAGVILRSSGIDGSIRGEAEADPITLEQPRPDLVILDDVQKDQKADSPLLCEKLIRLIDGAVTGMAGGGRHIDALMPCTVIREGDAADTYLDPLKKPDWQGERCQMVKSWPPGITDFEITFDTPAGKHWNAYAELRRTSLRDKGTIKDATNYYKENRKVMDYGFTVSWVQRFDTRSEISAQQHAMNLRLQLGQMFLPEYQNIGRRLVEVSDILITAKQLATKTIACKRGQVPPNCQLIGAHIDVQDEIMFWLVMASDHDYNATVIDYGTWPEVKTAYYTKAQCNSWSMVTQAFFEKFPQHKKKAYRTSTGKVRAPLEPKIYWSLGQTVNLLLSKTYIRQDSTKKQMKIDRVGVDTRWGQASETIKRFIREAGIDKLVPYYGQAFPPTNNQLEDYERREGWWFENMQHANVREPKWVMRPNPDGMWYMAADVNRLKDFVFGRLATPLGAPGGYTLHDAPEEYHELFAHHVCSSEYPEPVTARGRTKNQWKVREGSAFDNDYLDCIAGVTAILSSLGASLKTSDHDYTPVRRQLGKIAEKKRVSQGRKTASDRLVVR